MLQKLVLSALALLLPFLIIKLEKKVKPIEWLSPIVCCYALGILLGNLLGSFWDKDLARTLSEVSVMLSLPLLLISVDLLGWFKLAKTTILSFVILIICVMLVSYLVGTFFKDHDPEVWKMAGMLVGVYVGGTANLTAIGKILGVREDVFVMLNAVDLVFGGIYLLFIMSVGVKILTWILPAFNHHGLDEGEMDLVNWKKLGLNKKALHSVFLLCISGGIVGLSVLLSRMLTGEDLPSVIILGLTTLALLFSFNKKIRHFEGSQEWGQYFLMVFCVAVGSLADVSQLISGSAWYFLFTGLIMFGSIVLHFFCCYLFKIDRDTAIITSMAGIFGPAFVAPMSQVLKNKTILVSGVTTGLMGIALGNFVGVAVAYLIK
jgi:uncharacterized membrane protein